MLTSPRIRYYILTLAIFVVASISTGLCAEADKQHSTGQLLWGDTHLHTCYSLDAYTLGNHSADPDTAYRFAKGLAVIHPGHRAKVQIDRPLDFLVVTDHAEFLGVIPELAAGNPELNATRLGKKYAMMLRQDQTDEMFNDILSKANNNPEQLEPLNTEKVRRSIWARVVEAADAHYEPGKFTSIVGWEWSSTPGAKNLHRIVFTPDGGDKALRYVPYSLFDSQKPKDLWAWLEKTAEQYDTDFVAIGHNMNVSLGRFFPEADEDGNTISAAYAQARQRWEPVEEVVQFKGDSETHPLLSPSDEYADFETYKKLLGRNSEQGNNAKVMPGSFARSGLKRGLEIETRIGINPYKFGMIGASDSHTALSTVEEDNFLGKYAVDSTPESKHRQTTPGSVGWDASAAGLAGVWATGNTREEITEAFKRKEVYATTGPRILLRTFAGWDFKDADISAVNLAALGYSKGVPMGSDLVAAPKGKSVSLLIQAVKDPLGANLDRLQVVKGWVDEFGKSHEKVYTVAVSNSTREQGLNNSVNVETGTYDSELGDVELTAVWRDPDFNPQQNAFYYTRVLQVPTPRHTLYDTIALQVPPETSGHASVIQERAYSSPIWYSFK